jgi:adenylate cyclase
MVSGRLVLFGADLPLEDRRKTPYGDFYQEMLGSEIQAAAIQTILEGNYLAEVPQWLVIVADFLASLCAAWIAWRLSGWRLAFGLGVLTAILFAAATALFRANQIFPWTRSLLAASYAVGLTLALRSSWAERTGNRLRLWLRRFVGGPTEPLVETEDPEALRNTRESIEATVLFSDIRGFTSHSENRDPAAVTKELDPYLKQMTAIIARHGGKTNKFIGDGILAIFSDQDAARPGSHPARAVACGLEMTHNGSPFETGVGIHTGMVMQGYIGSLEKMDFTVLGDTVNTASRLESLTKEKHTRLIFSQATAERLGKTPGMMFLGDTQIRGKEAVLGVYTILTTSFAGSTPRVL